MDLRSYIKDNFVVGLSPMDGVTDEPFRLLQTKISKPDLLFTEFVSAEGITRGGVKLYDVLLYSPEERPIVGQLFGKDPESFYKAAIILCHLGFDGIDINMGCPAKTITQHGSGAALIGKPDLAAKLIRNVRQGIDDCISQKTTIDDLGLNQKTRDAINRNLKYSSFQFPVSGFSRPTLSVKTRLGITESVVDSWIPYLLDQNLDFLTLHGRTLKQGYSGFAAWDEITKAAKMAKAKNTPFFGNGDVTSRQGAVEFGQMYGVSGILIGRAAMGNPWIFKAHAPTLREKYDAMLLHSQLFKTIFPARTLDSLRHHFLLYASGHPKAKQLRAKIVALSSIEDIIHLEADFLA